jgi:hypothetical protein
MMELPRRPEYATPPLKGGRFAPIFPSVTVVVQVRPAGVLDLRVQERILRSCTGTIAHKRRGALRGGLGQVRHG